MESESKVLQLSIVVKPSSKLCSSELLFTGVIEFTGDNPIGRTQSKPICSYPDEHVKQVLESQELQLSLQLIQLLNEFK